MMGKILTLLGVLWFNSLRNYPVTLRLPFPADDADIEAALIYAEQLARAFDLRKSAAILSA